MDLPSSMCVPGDVAGRLTNGRESSGRHRQDREAKLIDMARHPSPALSHGLEIGPAGFATAALAAAALLTLVAVAIAGRITTPRELPQFDTDEWLGAWGGPEGTSLRIDGSNGNYELIVTDLDGSRRYAGVAVGDGIAFRRNGEEQVLRATDGEGTGMKWLVDKSDCLATRAGEGYCRD